jgi:hypothetical protein
VSGIGGESSLTDPPASRQSLPRSVCARAVTVHRRVHALPTNTSFRRTRDDKIFRTYNGTVHDLRSRSLLLASG